MEEHYHRPSVVSEFRRNPGRFLAYCALSRAFKEAGVWPMEMRCIVVAVVHPDWLPRYEWAAGLILELTATRLRRSPGTDVTNSLLKKPKSKGVSEVDVLGPFRRNIVVVPSLDVVPARLRLAATHIIHVGTPLVHHVRAARRLAFLPRLSEPVIQELVRANPDVFEAFVARRDVQMDDLRRAAGQKSAGSSGPKLSELPGYKKAREWAADLKSDVADWKAGRISWNEVRPRAVLHGPPGTGKTLFANALAGELDMPIVSTSVAEWQSSGQGYLGDMLRAMRASFSEAKELGSAVLFVDELDGLGRRGESNSKNGYYESNVVNCFLEMIDDISKAGGIILLGATNRIQDMDPAVLRSGRLETHIEIDLPDPLERAQILRHHLSNDIGLSDVKRISDRLGVVSASDLELLARKARRRARQDSRAVTLEDVRKQLPERLKLPEASLRRIAIHECGHALVALASKLADDIAIEIEDDYLANSGGVQDGGFMQYRMIEDILPTEATLLARIRICLAGMAAEEVVYGSRSIGSAGHPASDLAEATMVAAQMVLSFGMGKSLLFVKGWKSVKDDLSLPPELRQEVASILAQEYKAAKQLLAKDKAILVREAAELIVDRRREYVRT